MAKKKKAKKKALKKRQDVVGVDEHVLDRLYVVINSRKGADPDTSYTARLFSRGRICQPYRQFDQPSERRRTESLTQGELCAVERVAIATGRGLDGWEGNPSRWCRRHRRCLRGRCCR